MSYTEVKTVVTGSRWSATDWNTYIRDNFAAGVPDIFTAKSDLAIATGANAATRLAVGSTGKVLTVDHSATSGVKWAYLPENDPIVAKGDLAVGSAADTLTRLAVSTTGKILSANPSQTGGMQWITEQIADPVTTKGDMLAGYTLDSVIAQTVGADGYELNPDWDNNTTRLQWGYHHAPGFGFKKNAASTNLNGATEKITGTIWTVYSNGSDWNDTSKRFDVSRTGYYFVGIVREYDTATALSANDQLRTMIYLSGGLKGILGMNVGMATVSVGVAHVGYDIIYATAGQYLDFYWYQNTGADVNYKTSCRYYIAFLGS